MPKIERYLDIRIPEGYMKREFDWRYQSWGQDAVKTYLVKHSDLIDEGLTLVGVGELPHNALPSKQKLKRCCDMIFRKGDVYYVVEVKTSRDYAWTELLDEVACCEYEMRQNNEPYEEIVPVLVTVDNSIEKASTPFPREMEQWMKDYLKKLLEGK